MGRWWLGGWLDQRYNVVGVGVVVVIVVLFNSQVWRSTRCGRGKLRTALWSMYKYARYLSRVLAVRGQAPLWTLIGQEATSTACDWLSPYSRLAWLGNPVLDYMDVRT